MYWDLTAEELNALLEAIGKRRQQEREDAFLRAGIGAAATLNVHRRKGSRPIRAEDFVPRPPRRVTAQQFRAILSGWAQQQNARAARSNRT